MDSVYDELKSKALQLCRENRLLEEKIVVRAWTLTPEEAIGKPVIFYGTTIAGAAYLMGWDRFCAASK